MDGIITEWQEKVPYFKNAIKDNVGGYNEESPSKIVAEEIVKYISKEMKKSLIKPEFKKELKSLLNWVFYYLWFIPNILTKGYTFMRKNINQKNSKNSMNYLDHT